MIDPEFQAQLASDAEASLSEEGDDGTATVEEENPAPKPKDDSAAADEGDSSDESDEEEEADEDSSDEEDESEEDSDEEESEDEDDSEEDDDVDEAEEPAKPGSRAQARIKQLLKAKKLTDDENAVLRAQLAAKDASPAEKAKADQALLDKGYTPEQVEAGKKFLKELGYLPPEQITELQKQIKSMQDEKLIAQDRAELRQAITKSKVQVSEEEVMKQVRKWASHSDPKIQARASLDYPAILRLMASKKAATKVETVVVKKKIAPKVPKGGGGPAAETQKDDGIQWDPGDRRGSTARLLALAADSLEDGE